MIGGFGLIIPESITSNGESVRSWGARAIFNDRGQFDLVSDRQEVCLREGDTTLVTAAGDTKVHELFHWIDNAGLPWLRKEAVKLRPNSRETVHFSKQRFSIVASPNASFGYLYIWACEHRKAVAQYELAKPDPLAKWNGETIPAIGDRVNVTMNGFGPGKVVGYFVEYGYLGVHVKVDNQPDWHVRQGGRQYICVFGGEIERI